MNGAKLPRPPVHRITLVQLFCLVIAWWAVSASVGGVAASSFLYGGLIAVSAQAYFAFQVFRYTGAQAAPRIARASIAGEVGKFVLTVTGFGLVFALVRPLEGWAVFAGYGVMLIIQVVGSALLLPRNPAPTENVKS